MARGRIHCYGGSAGFVLKNKLTGYSESLSEMVTLLAGSYIDERIGEKSAGENVGVMSSSGKYVELEHL